MDIHNFSPSMLTYPDPNDFDYGAFLQQTPGAEDVNFHATTPNPQLPHGSPPQQIQGTTFSDSSLGRGTGTPPSSDGRSGSTELVRKTSSASAALTQKQRLERRGHTKSRRGCYNCKRRRIKVCLSPGCGGGDADGVDSARRLTPPVGIVSRRG